MRKVIIVVLLSLILSANALAASENKESFKIGINNFGQANFLARLARETMIEEVERLGGIPLATVTDNVPERINAIENYITQGVDAIIIEEGDIKMAEPALKEAKKRGIIIASMDAGISEYVDIVIESNNWCVGAMAACELMERINGEGKIVEIYNDLGQMIRMRRAALHAVLTEYPNVEVAAGFVYAWPDFFPDAKAKMEAILQAHPDIKGVFATFDGVGLAAAQAIREAGLQDQIVVVGIDGEPIAFEEMKKPDTPFKATVALDFETMARTVVNMVFDLLNGKEVPLRHVYVPATLVTVETLPEFLEENPEYLKENE